MGRAALGIDQRARLVQRHVERLLYQRVNGTEVDEAAHPAIEAGIDYIARAEDVDRLRARPFAHRKRDVGSGMVDHLGAVERTIRFYKRAELREYFRDECLADYEPRTRRLGEVSQSAAVVYPILLPDRLELVVDSRSGFERFTVAVPGEEVDEAARTLRRKLVERTSFE